MPTSLPQHDPRSADARGLAPLSERDSIRWMLVMPAAFVALATSFPPGLVLPALSLLLVALGTGVAGWNWSRRASVPARMDLAAGLLLTGFGASMMADIPEALRTLEDLQGALRAPPGR